MTKKVRIVNADTSDYVVIVESYQVSPDGTDDILLETRELHNAADLLEVVIWDSKYVKIKEVPKSSLPKS